MQLIIYRPRKSIIEKGVEGIIVSSSSLINIQFMYDVFKKKTGAKDI